MKYFFISLFFISSFSLTAQEKLEYIDFGTIKKDFNRFVKDKEYEKAITELEKINSNDSSYYSSLTSRTYYSINLKKYEEAILLANEGLNHKNKSSRRFFFNNKAIAYINLEKYDKAIATINTGLKEFPMSYLLIFNKAVALEELKKYSEASKMYQKSIIINPYYANSHIKLGYICYQFHKTTMALMCFNMYLLLKPDGKSSLSALESINKSVSAKYTEPKLEGKNALGDNDSFEEIDLILDNHAALSKKYKIKNKITLALVKQNHAFLEMLNEYESEEDNFWNNKYVPLYKWIYENKHFDNFAYTISFSVENAKFKPIITKNISNIKFFLTAFYKKWPKLAGKNKIKFDKKKQEVIFSYQKSLLEGIGIKKNNIMVGKWEVYNDDGKIVTKALFNDDGKKDGIWAFYDNEGYLQKKESYKNGKLDGIYSEYFKSGKMSYFSTYTDGNLTGKYKKYTKTGAIIEEGELKNGKINGNYHSYYDLGKKYPDYTIPYKEGKIEGEVTEYWQNGNIYYKVNFVNSKREGIQTKYYYHNKISSKSNYINGVINGKYTSYHKNGNIKDEGNIEDDLNSGEWTTYYKNGKIKNTYNYSKGKLDGTYNELDVDGKLYFELTYRKGEIIAYKYYAKNGNIIKEAKKQKGEFYYEGHYKNGNIQSEGLYDVGGGKKGEWKFYDINGVLESKGFFKDGKAHGENINYFKNGKVKSISKYRNDSVVDYYVSYFIDGQIYQQGWYKYDDLFGQWNTYYANGNISEINFYHRGKLHGKQENYAVDGKLDYISNYKYGDLITEYYFDSKGDTMDYLNYNTDSVNFTLTTHYNKNTYKTVVQYIHGIKHGKIISYYFDGKKYVEGENFNNNRSGTWTWYHKNGQIKTKGKYIKGDKHGLWVDFYDNGKPKKRLNYSYGVKDGKWQFFNKQGILTQDYEYIDGLENGAMKFYDDDGKLQLIRYYKDDQIIGYSYLGKDGKEIPMKEIENETGKIISYFDNGKVSREFEIKNGNFVNSYKEYYYYGQLSEDHFYSDGRLDEKDISYYPNGKIKSVELNKLGKLNGVAKKYYENGSLKKEITYLNDAQHGETNYYDSSGKLTSKEIYFNDHIESKQIF